MRKKSIAIVLMLAVFITFMPVCMSYAAGSAPGKVKVTSVKAKKASAKTGKAKVTVKWKKQKGATGYEVFVKRVDGKWKLAKTVSGNSGSAKIKAFVGKNSVRVRALSKTADGTAYGKYSKAKKFRVNGKRTIQKYYYSHSCARRAAEKQARKEGLKIKFRDNDVIYIYDLKNDVKSKKKLTPAIRKQLDDLLAENEADYIDMIKSLEKELKVGGVRIIVKYTYKGDKIVTHVFE